MKVENAIAEVPWHIVTLATGTEEITVEECVHASQRPVGSIPCPGNKLAHYLLQRCPGRIEQLLGGRTIDSQGLHIYLRSFPWPAFAIKLSCRYGKIDRSDIDYRMEIRT